jgi:hypothetical protein
MIRYKTLSPNYTFKSASCCRRDIRINTFIISFYYCHCFRNFMAGFQFTNIFYKIPCSAFTRSDATSWPEYLCLLFQADCICRDLADTPVRFRNRNKHLSKQKCTSIWSSRSLQTHSLSFLASFPGGINFRSCNQ